MSSAALVERKISKSQEGGNLDNKQGNELPGEKRKIEGKNPPLTLRANDKPKTTYTGKCIP